jgi:hypothetical protein
VTLDPKTLRFLALLSAPLFVLLRNKLGVEVPEAVQELLVGTVALYILGSHGKEAIVKRAEVAASAAASAVTTDNAAAIIREAAKPEVTP